ncbi:oligoribonuclease [Corynebacterium lactis]|uniref:Oligoribonuclease n=1 Tax=Corynebacterium lactis RW2-5 TaxID=1408189 RepID=A0A0K2GZ09_9CORY|nr:oligoribonuclease [Corynebacterium lactis]ALA66913.1 oligoribonuclease [Corynebacterium lactis RW2-5]
MAQNDPDLDLSPAEDRIVWIDCEMTGLEPERHVMVEIAALVTDANLNVLGEGVDIVIHATETELAQMDDFVTQMHANSGLDDEIRASEIDITAAEKAVLDYVRAWVPDARTAPLAGNSIASDRKFIHRYMPELDQHLHYRMIDVSSFKEAARRWYPGVLAGAPEKGLAHRALADIKESIRELDYYRRVMMVAHPGPNGEEIRAAAEASAEKFGDIRG